MESELYSVAMGKRWGFQVREWAGQICQQHLGGCTAVVRDGVRETSGEAVWAGVLGLSEKRCGDLS